jgi:AcrR family transcriptional regulator
MSSRRETRRAEQRTRGRGRRREGPSDLLELWTRPDRQRRRPRFTREEIAAAAIRIADAEGFEELSMRRLASELGAGTMTLYHYVRTKDELLALVSDTIMTEVLVPDDELPDDWREALTTIARRSRDALRRHPWVLDVRDEPAPGPNGIRHWDQSMRAVGSLDLSIGAQFELVSAVDEYVFGFCLQERVNRVDDRTSSGAGLDELREYLAALIETGEYPTLAAITEDPGLDEVWRQLQRQITDPERFDRNLGRLLDGFEAEIQRGRGPR